MLATDMREYPASPNSTIRESAKVVGITEAKEERPTT